MKKIKGPAIFLAQFVGEEAPFNSLDNICKWASSLGYKGVQIPSWDSRLIDLKKASESKDYCDEIKGTLKNHNLELTELSTHLQGQLVAVHPAYDIPFDGFAVENVYCLPGVPSILKSMLGGLNNKIKGGKKISTKTISVQTVESEIANELGNIQKKFKSVDIGSYPFFRLGKIGVSIVIRSTYKKKIDECYKEIVNFLKKNKINIMERL